MAQCMFCGKKIIGLFSMKTGEGHLCGNCGKQWRLDEINDKELQYFSRRDIGEYQYFLQKSAERLRAFEFTHFIGDILIDDNHGWLTVYDKENFKNKEMLYTRNPIVYELDTLLSADLVFNTFDEWDQCEKSRKSPGKQMGSIFLTFHNPFIPIKQVLITDKYHYLYHKPKLGEPCFIFENEPATKETAGELRKYLPENRGIEYFQKKFNTSREVAKQILGVYLKERMQMFAYMKNTKMILADTYDALVHSYTMEADIAGAIKDDTRDYSPYRRSEKEIQDGIKIFGDYYIPETSKIGVPSEKTCRVCGLSTKPEEMKEDMCSCCYDSFTNTDMENEHDHSMKEFYRLNNVTAEDLVNFRIINRYMLNGFICTKRLGSIMVDDYHNTMVFGKDGDTNAKIRKRQCYVHQMGNIFSVQTKLSFATVRQVNYTQEASATCYLNIKYKTPVFGTSDACIRIYDGELANSERTVKDVVTNKQRFYCPEGEMAAEFLVSRSKKPVKYAFVTNGSVALREMMKNLTNGEITYIESNLLPIPDLRSASERMEHDTFVSQSIGCQCPPIYLVPVAEYELLGPSKENAQIYVQNGQQENVLDSQSENVQESPIDTTASVEKVQQLMAKSNTEQEEDNYSQALSSILEAINITAKIPEQEIYESFDKVLLKSAVMLTLLAKEDIDETEDAIECAHSDRLSSGLPLGNRSDYDDEFDDLLFEVMQSKLGGGEPQEQPQVQQSQVHPQVQQPQAPQPAKRPHFCYKCGFPLSEDSIFCWECGTKIDE